MKVACDVNIIISSLFFAGLWHLAAPRDSYHRRGSFLFLCYLPALRDWIAADVVRGAVRKINYLPAPRD